MIPLKEWQLNLIKRLEKENSSDYDVEEIDADYFIRIDDLLDALDETQDYRQYAKDKVVELSNALNSSDYYDDTLDRLIRTEGSLRKAKERIKELEEKLEQIQNMLDEDDYDRLAMEGVEL